MENAKRGADQAWPGARFLEQGCIWWVGHGFLMILGGLAFVVALFFGISRTRYDPGNPILFASAGIIYFGAAAALVVASSLLGVGIRTVGHEHRAEVRDDFSPAAVGRLPSNTVAAALVWVFGVLGSLAVVVWGLGFVIPSPPSRLLLPAAAWAAGGGALAAGLIMWGSAQPPTTGAQDFAYAFVPLLVYAAANLLGASLMIIGFAGNLFEAFLLVAVLGAILLIVIAPILGIAAFRRLQRVVGRTAPIASAEHPRS